jgi:hypothetical protein
MVPCAATKAINPVAFTVKFVPASIVPPVVAQWVPPIAFAAEGIEWVF